MYSIEFNRRPWIYGSQAEMEEEEEDDEEEEEEFREGRQRIMSPEETTLFAVFLFCFSSCRIYIQCYRLSLSLFLSLSLSRSFPSMYTTIVLYKYGEKAETKGRRRQQ